MGILYCHALPNIMTLQGPEFDNGAIKIMKEVKHTVKKGLKCRFWGSAIGEIMEWLSPQTFKSSCVTEGLISTAQASQRMRRRTQDEVHSKPAIFISLFLEREKNTQHINKGATKQCKLSLQHESSRCRPGLVCVDSLWYYTFVSLYTTVYIRANWF